jgi:hypothetical protein
MNVWAMILVAGSCTVIGGALAVKRLLFHRPSNPNLDALGVVSQSWITDKRADRDGRLRAATFYVRSGPIQRWRMRARCP